MYDVATGTGRAAAAADGAARHVVATVGNTVYASAARTARPTKSAATVEALDFS